MVKEKSNSRTGGRSGGNRRGRGGGKKERFGNKIRLKGLNSYDNLYKKREKVKWEEEFGECKWQRRRREIKEKFSWLVVEVVVVVVVLIREIRRTEEGNEIT